MYCTYTHMYMYLKSPVLQRNLTSRSVAHMRHDSAYGVPKSQVYHPDSNLVVNGCTIRMRLKRAPVAPQLPVEKGSECCHLHVLLTLP